jgi:hypothetical protein
MANESTAFGFSTLTTVVGLLIMLYGVSLTSGEELTTFTIAGGIIVLVAISIHTGLLLRLKDTHGVE